MNFSNQTHPPTEQQADDFHCLACGLFFPPALLSDGGLCAVCDSLSVDYTDDEILDAFTNWRQYQKPTMTRIEKPHWRHGRRG